ncbi:MAG: hypothetical protein E7455_08555 [Ruminococcaceae bacterium]|nr:hypothetical protein [Oscillospiraceae bacterium]
MNDKAIKLFRLIYGIAVSIMLGVSAVLLIAACLQIYQSGGEQIYTPEKVAAAFAPISMPIYITLALVAGSFLLTWLLPTEKKRLPMQKQYVFLLHKAYEKADLEHCNTELLQKLRQEQKKRRLALSAALAVWVIGGIVFLPQACNSSNYSEELHLATDSVVALVWWLIPCTLIPTGFSIFSAYYARSSIRRELELVKLAPKAVNAPLPHEKKADQKLLLTRLAILVIALGLLIGGYVAGGTADVLAKAVAICTECVGLG